MSKTALKKELQRLDNEALRSLIIDLYEARREAKEYLDFFTNPDVGKMLDRYKAAVEKEMGRVARGRARLRMTRIKKMVKDFASFNPGDEWVAELMAHVVETACATGNTNWIKEATQESIARFLGDALAFIDSHGLAADYLPRLVNAIDSIRSSFLHPCGLKHRMRLVLENFRAGI